MTETELPPEHPFASPHEPWHHIVAFLTIATVLFLISAVLFRALEGAF